MPKAEGNTQMTLQHETSCPFQFHPRGICYKGGEAYFKPFLPSFLKPPHPGPQLCPIQAAKIRCYLKQSGLKTSKNLHFFLKAKLSLFMHLQEAYCLFFETVIFSLTLNVHNRDQDKAVKFNSASNFICSKYIKRSRVSSRFWRKSSLTTISLYFCVC